MKRGWRNSQVWIAGLVCAGVVKHDVHVKTVGNGSVDRVEEPSELDRATLGAGLVHDLSGREVRCCEQISDAVAFVVMRATLDLAGTHRQDRLGSIQRLDAGLLIDTPHDRVFRRVHVEADHIADLVDELRIFGELERVRQPRLQSGRMPDPPGRRRRDSSALREISGRPMRRVGRLVFNVRTPTTSTSSSLIVRGAPGRGSSTQSSRERFTLRSTSGSQYTGCCDRPPEESRTPRVQQEILGLSIRGTLGRETSVSHFGMGPTRFGDDFFGEGSRVVGTDDGCRR